jgi:hypothetical protein
MIDNYAKAMQLVRQMEQNLPVPARPTSAFIRAMKMHGIKIARDQDLPIKSVFYMGDEGGISCDVTPPGMKDPIICSITQIRIKSSHPLADEIRAYQMERQQRLAQAGGGGEPTSFTVRPRQKRHRG